MKRIIRIGSRESVLAVAQAQLLIDYMKKNPDENIAIPKLAEISHIISALLDQGFVCTGTVKHDQSETDQKNNDKQQTVIKISCRFAAGSFPLLTHALLL